MEEFANDPSLNLAGRLLGADEDYPERAPAFGDVEQHILDWTGAFAQGVLIQLVDHLKQPTRSGGLLASSFGHQDDTDDKALGTLRQVVQVDDGDLLVVGADPAGRP